MDDSERYKVVLLPHGELVAKHCTLREALAFVHGYQEVSSHEPGKAVIACEEREPSMSQQLALMGPSRRRSQAARSVPAQQPSFSA